MRFGICKKQLINGQTNYIGKERKREIKADQTSGQAEEKGGASERREPKEEIDASQIEISVPRQSEIEEEEPMSGRVEYFTASKGYGFIKDAAGSEKYFFHITNAPAGIAEGDRVTFELERGTRGMNAVRIVISNK